MAVQYYSMTPRIRLLNFASIVYLFPLLIINSRKVSAQPFGKFCLNVTYNPTIDTTFPANLNSLLSYLSSNASMATTSNNGFYESTAGHGSDAVHGLYLCRGDLSRDNCTQCVEKAKREILEECPNDKAAIVWYDNCLLRYSNQSDFPQGLFIYAWNKEKSDDPGRLNEYVSNQLNDLATQASHGSGGAKFAVQQGKFSDSERVFSLAQCTPDLSSVDCDICLRKVIDFLPKCCNGTKGGRVLSPSCFFRYEGYLFYNPPVPAPPPVQNLPPPLPPPPPPPLLSDTSGTKGKGQISGAVITAIVVSIVVSIMLIVVAFLCLRRRSRKRIEARSYMNGGENGNDMSSVESFDYNLSQIQAATNNFSGDCKIGEGGFGPVYKGTLANGQEIAVKRLSKGSLQGAEEFKTEIALVARLQHRNLVQLLGFCFEDEEMLLIYEYVHNKSLDIFLFDPEKQPLLDWSRRYKIIGGIARGLLYLHEDSRLRIVHRDLKASNVLLDENMNPKIADFGLARIFDAEQSRENTSRIAGTHGYMAPEYAMHGRFSVKSDVFSFGVLLLEILSGKKNSTFFQSNGVVDLLGHAWKSLRNGTPLALLDPSVGELYAANEVIKCIHIGLLCVQDDSELRPTMASVAVMLNSNSVTLPIPHHPAFYYESRTEAAVPSESSDKSSGKSLPPRSEHNDASISELYPR